VGVSNGAIAHLGEDGMKRLEVFDPKILDPVRAGCLPIGQFLGCFGEYL